MQIYIDKKTFFNNMMFFHVFPIQADVQVLTRRGETPGGPYLEGVASFLKNIGIRTIFF